MPLAAGEVGEADHEPQAVEAAGLKGKAPAAQGEVVEVERRLQRARPGAGYGWGRDPFWEWPQRHWRPFRLCMARIQLQNDVEG